MMINTFLNARSVLDAANFRTFIPQPTAQYLYFEDSNLLGALHVISSVKEIVHDWEMRQDHFLRENAARLTLDPLKAWNCYTVFLTPESAEKEDSSVLFAIEEDFRGTRKIVRAGIITKNDVESALSPLLPLRRLLSLTPDDVRKRIATRLGEPDSPLQALLSDTEAEKIATCLIGST